MAPCRQVDVQTSHGLVTFDYVISTPNEASAKAIDPSLPTVLLLHAVFFGKSLLHYQFADANLRRFNLVAVDLLCHGETKGLVPDEYTQKTGAADIVKLMDALNLPPCVVFGVSMGSMFAMQLAVSFPERVTGLFLVSPLCTPELPEVAEGRRQITEMWNASFASPSDVQVVDQEAMEHAWFGALELGFNAASTGLVQALIKITYPECLRAQETQPEGCIRAIRDIFIDRTGYDAADFAPLARSQVPIALVHGVADIAYPPEYYAEFASQLSDAGVNVRVHEVEGAPHFASATHPTDINPLLVSLVLDSWDGGQCPEPAGTSILSPFDAALRVAGWKPVRDDDEDSDHDHGHDITIDA